MLYPAELRGHGARPERAGRRPDSTKRRPAKCGARGLAVALGLALALSGAAGARACTGETFVAELQAVSDEGDLVLADGRRLAAFDLRLRDLVEPGGAPAAAAFRNSLAGAAISVVAGPADRWGRLPARIRLGRGEAGVDLAELLAGEGFARVDPGEREALCQPGLLAIEEKARAARRGGWAVWPVLDAGKPDALREQAGRFAVMEGRILSVGERRDRTYLNFGRDFSRDFAVVLPRRAWAAFKRRTKDAAGLRGRIVRVRGLLEMRRAPSMEIVAVDVLEFPRGDARQTTTQDDHP